MTTNTDVTQAQIADLAAAETACANCDGRGRWPKRRSINPSLLLLECPDCKGTGLRFPWARVEHPQGEHDSINDCEAYECPGYRVATLEEIIPIMDKRLFKKWAEDIDEIGEWIPVVATSAAIAAVHAAWKAEIPAIELEPLE